MAWEGRITGMEKHEESVSVMASLPDFHYKALVEAIAINTEGCGRIERKD